MKTEVTWDYQEKSARLISSYAAVTEAKEGTERGTLFALLRHQWLHAASPLTEYIYQSARGVRKVAAGPAFSTSMVFNGILPAMPNAGLTKSTLAEMIGRESSEFVVRDTYNGGKALGKTAYLVQLVDFAGDTVKRDALLKNLKSSLEEWFTTGGNGQFYYHKPWSTLVRYPADYFSDARLTDHHFHHAYFIQAAADTLFGRFKYFDPYEGHGWADGIGFERGNNQESSSESMNWPTFSQGWLGENYDLKGRWLDRPERNRLPD